MKAPISGSGGKVSTRIARNRTSGWLELVKKTTGIDPRTHECGTALLLLDCSESMARGNRIRSAIEGARKLGLETIAAGYEVGLILFASEATFACAPTREGIERNLEDITCAGSTNLAAALSIALTNLSERHQSRRVIVVTTDGYADDADTALSIAATAKAQGIEILVVGTEDADQGFLGKLASRSEGTIVVARTRIGAGLVEATRLLLRP